MRDLRIGETVMRSRKALGLTQEQLGGRIGVSAGAVSKWETDSALPDISLLAPLARALDISLDELLRFERELTGEEYTATIKRIEDAFLHEGAPAGREKLYEALGTYPNNGGLKILGAKCIRMYSGAPEDEEQPLKEALSLYQDALGLEGGKFKQAALFGMADIYMLQGRYEESQACLAQLAEGSGFDPMLLYPRLLIEQEQWEGAKSACKGQLLQYLNAAASMLAQLAHVAKQQGDEERELLYLEKQHLLEEGFETGLCMGRLALARYYLEQKDYPQASAWFLAYVKGVISFPLDYSGHPVFDGVALQADRQAQHTLRRTLLRELLQNTAYDPIRHLPEFEEAQRLVNSFLGAGTK